VLLQQPFMLLSLSKYTADWGILQWHRVLRKLHRLKSVKEFWQYV